MDILSQCPKYLPVKNNPILNAFSYPGTTRSRKLYSGDTVKKSILEVRAYEIHTQSLEDMRNSVRLPLVKLKKSFREHQYILNEIIRRCQEIHKAGVKVFRKYNLNQCMEFVMGEKLKKGLNQTESVCRASLTNVAFQCQELKNLFIISGLQVYGDMCSNLRDICATATIEIKIKSCDTYPTPAVICKDVTTTHIITKSNSKTALKKIHPPIEYPTVDRRTDTLRPSSAPSVTVTGRGSGNRGYSPNGRPQTANSTGIRNINNNNSSNTNGSGRVQQKRELPETNGSSSSNGSGDEYQDDIYDDEFDEDAELVQSRPASGTNGTNNTTNSNTNMNRQTDYNNQSMNYDDVDETIPEDDGSGEEYDPDPEAEVEVDYVSGNTSPIHMKSAEYNRNRPISAKRLQEMKLQALPTVIYNTELDAGRATQWHPLPCPHCCKLFKGEGKDNTILY